MTAEFHGQSSAEISRPAQSNEEPKNSRNLPFVPVKLCNGIVIKALVDTNSTNSSINPKIVNDMRDEDVKILSTDKTIHMRDGKTTSVNETAELTLTVDNNPAVQHNFNVVNVPLADMVLGYDFIEDKKAMMKFGRGGLSLELKNVQTKMEKEVKTNNLKTDINQKENVEELSTRRTGIT